MTHNPIMYAFQMIYKIHTPKRIYYQIAHVNVMTRKHYTFYNLFIKISKKFKYKYFTRFMKPNTPRIQISSISNTFNKYHG